MNEDPIAAEAYREPPHLEIVAQRLKQRYGHLPFYVNAERRTGAGLWLALAASAWNLDGLAPNPSGRPSVDHDR